jgi:uncharacterized protein YdaU (DUF1376 family)
MHYYQHHIGDFIKATARLTDGQSMAYLRLLWMYYDSEKPLKPDSKVLAFQIGATIEETELLLESFFWLAENGWHHTRCDEEIAEYRAFLAKKSNAGRASAERRKNGGATDVEQVLNGRSTDVQLTNNQEPITKKQRKPSPKVEQTLDEYLADCKEAGKKPVPEDHPIRAYAEDAGIDMDMLAINWLVFKDRHLGTPKLYKDWPGAFANSVKSRWYNIWFSDGEEMKWTSTGLQEKKVYDSRMKEANHG